MHRPRPTCFAFVIQVTKDLICFCFRVLQNNGYEWICISNFVSVLTVCMCARMSVSGGILPVDVFILLFVAHCILFLRVRIFFSRAFDKNENGSFVPNEFFSTFFLNAKTIVLVSMVAS